SGMLGPSGAAGGAERSGTIDAAGVLAWVHQRWPRPDACFADERGGVSLAREAMAELDLLAVHLLTAEDAPELLSLLRAAPGDEPAALAGWQAHRDAIDRAARSRRLRKDPLYRPFCV